MEYGDTIKGKCKFCDCVNLFFLGKTTETYSVGSIPKKYLRVICLGCHTAQWIEKVD